MVAIFWRRSGYFLPYPFDYICVLLCPGLWILSKLGKQRFDSGSKVRIKV